MSDEILRLHSLNCGYGQAMVIHDLSLSVKRGEALAVLGKNGMGKSTLLNGIMGFLPRQENTVFYLGEPLVCEVPHRLAKLGIAYAQQEKAVFQDLSVEDNLRIAVADRRQFARGLERIADYFPFIPKRLQQKAGTLSGGEQKMLILGRALMMEPTLLLLDEISEGLQPSVIESISRVLHTERKTSSVAMLIVEQNVSFALKTADNFAVLERGELGVLRSSHDADAHVRILDELGV
jgi:ABC-type branched-subunit amino acid transport system ATPase component